MAKEINVLSFNKFKQNKQKIVALTAYDYSLARILDNCDVDVILVGDSLGMVALGQPTTHGVTVDDIIHHTKAVVRAVKKVFVVADMPFMSYQSDFKTAVDNAGRLIKEGGAKAVKIEGACGHNLNIIKHLTQIGIPVMGHLGFTPQSVNAFGGNLVQAKEIDTITKLLNDAKALENSGVFSLVLEMVPSEVAKLITEQLSIPTIGIGAGSSTDGQILVTQDMLGLFTDFKPKFVRQYLNMADLITTAVNNYASDVKKISFPDTNESFALEANEVKNLNNLLGSKN